MNELLEKAMDFIRQDPLTDEVKSFRSAISKVVEEAEQAIFRKARAEFEAARDAYKNSPEGKAQSAKWQEEKAEKAKARKEFRQRIRTQGCIWQVSGGIVIKIPLRIGNSGGIYYTLKGSKEKPLKLSRSGVSIDDWHLYVDREEAQAAANSNLEFDKMMAEKLNESIKKAELPNDVTELKRIIGNNHPDKNPDADLVIYQRAVEKLKSMRGAA
jgi:hypothetical protein